MPVNSIQYNTIQCNAMQCNYGPVACYGQARSLGPEIKANFR